jgi:hypothetical protein
MEQAWEKVVMHPAEHNIAADNLLPQEYPQEGDFLEKWKQEVFRIENESSIADDPRIALRKSILHFAMLWQVNLYTDNLGAGAHADPEFAENIRELLQSRLGDVTSTCAYVRAKVIVAILRLYTGAHHRDAKDGDWLDYYVDEVHRNMSVLHTMIRLQTRNDLNDKGLKDYMFEVWQDLMEQSKQAALLVAPGVVLVPRTGSK